MKGKTDTVYTFCILSKLSSSEKLYGWFRTLWCRPEAKLLPIWIGLSHIGIYPDSIFIETTKTNMLILHEKQELFTRFESHDTCVTFNLPVDCSPSHSFTCKSLARKSCILNRGERSFSVANLLVSVANLSNIYGRLCRHTKASLLQNYELAVDIHWPMPPFYYFFQTKWGGLFVQPH